MLRFLATNSPALRNCFNIESYSALFGVLKRHDFTDHVQCTNPEELPKYEVSKDPKEWEYVERLLPIKIVPDFKPKDEYPSGWTPQKYDSSMPYIIQRTRNNMLPIYLFINERHRGTHRYTKIKHVHGDIHKFAKDIQRYLEMFSKQPIHVRVFEMNGSIHVRGDHVNNLKIWALNKNM